MYTLRSLLHLRPYNRINKFSKYSLCTKAKPKEDTLDDGPIKFSTSPARTYRARTTRTGEYEARLWYEPYVIMASISVFLFYFCVLREENDIDVELSTSLYSRIKGLEELQLNQSLEYNRRHGLDTEDIIKRLKEIDKNKSNVSANDSS